MYCVFSKFLLRHYANLHNIEPTEDDYENIKPSQLLQKKVNPAWYLFSYNSYQTDEETDKLYGTLSQYQMYTIVKWVHYNIINQLLKINRKTLNVKIRIVNGMINNIVYKKTINKDIAINLCNNFVSNVKDLWFDINSEDLPF